MTRQPCGHPPKWNRNGCLDCRLDRILADSIERTQRKIEAVFKRLVKAGA